MTAGARWRVRIEASSTGYTVQVRSTIPLHSTGPGTKFGPGYWEDLFHLRRLVGVVAFTEDFGLDDLVGRGRIGGLRIAALELGEDVVPFDDAAEGGMPAVEVVGGSKSEEELRAAGVFSRMGHAQRSAK